MSADSTADSTAFGDVGAARLALLLAFCRLLCAVLLRLHPRRERGAEDGRVRAHRQAALPVTRHAAKGPLP
eukprot:scaffold8876_cov65-Phaeocystis_antarctica.AAC.2